MNTFQNEYAQFLSQKVNSVQPFASSVIKKGCFIIHTTLFPRLNKDDKEKLLHLVASFEVDQNVREAATQMEDTSIIAKLSEGDFIAREVCYHKQCMTKFLNKYRAFLRKKNNSGRQQQHNLENIALAQALSYIEETLQSCDDEVAPFMKLSSVQNYYSSYLMQMNAEFTTVNATRLKDKILKLNLALEATAHMEEVFISYKDDLAAAFGLFLK